MNLANRIIVLDPTEGPLQVEAELAPRVSGVDGKRIAFINNGKRNSDVFLATLVEEFREKHHVEEVIWLDKKNSSLPIGQDILERLKSCHAVVAGVGD